MSYIIGKGNDAYASFTLNPGHATQIWWYGFGGANLGYPIPPPIATVSNRVVVDNQGMEYVDWPDYHGVRHTVNVHAENSTGTGIAALFRIEIGSPS